jgi:hypothetical protein
MRGEKWIRKDVERNGSGLFDMVSWDLTAEAGGSHIKPAIIACRRTEVTFYEPGMLRI